MFPRWHEDMWLQLLGNIFTCGQYAHRPPHSLDSQNTKSILKIYWFCIILPTGRYGIRYLDATSNRIPSRGPNWSYPKRNHILKLNNNVYVLKQGTYNWYKKLNKYLVEKILKPSDIDPSLYIVNAMIALM